MNKTIFTANYGVNTFKVKYDFNNHLQFQLYINAQNKQKTIKSLIGIREKLYKQKIKLTFAVEMKTKNIHSNLPLGQKNDRLAGYLPADSCGCSMYFIELKCKL